MMRFPELMNQVPFFHIWPMNISFTLFCIYRCIDICFIVFFTSPAGIIVYQLVLPWLLRMNWERLTKPIYFGLHPGKKRRATVTGSTVGWEWTIMVFVTKLQSDINGLFTIPPVYTNTPPLNRKFFRWYLLHIAPRTNSIEHRETISILIGSITVPALVISSGVTSVTILLRRECGNLSSGYFCQQEYRRNHLIAKFHVLITTIVLNADDILCETNVATPVKSLELKSIMGAYLSL